VNADLWLKTFGWMVVLSPLIFNPDVEGTTKTATQVYLEKVTSPDQQIVVIGRGAVTPLGLTLKESWHRLVNGESGIDYIYSYPWDKTAPVRVAGEVPLFGEKVGEDLKYLDQFCIREISGMAKLIARPQHWALRATIEAQQNAGLLAPRKAGGRDISPDVHPLGIFIGSTMGHMEAYENAFAAFFRDEKFFPLTALQTLTTAPFFVGQALGASGPLECSSTACSSGSNAIIHGAQMLRLGEIKVAVVGGTDDQITQFGIPLREGLRAMTPATDPDGASRPFDKDRNGFVMGAGAGILIMTTLAWARENGFENQIEAHLAGWAQTSGGTNITKPDVHAEAEAMVLALERAGIPPEQVGFISAHATSTLVGDDVELRAATRALGPWAERIPISAVKAAIGHTLGASGPIASNFAIQSLIDGVIPGNRNLREVDPRLARYTNLLGPGYVHLLPGYAGLVPSFGMGGHNNALVWVAP
jgi:3-oxoacyl-[acyl-carrier-protein] synthase II